MKKSIHSVWISVFAPSLQCDTCTFFSLRLVATRRMISNAMSNVYASDEKKTPR
jgi:hypothetical protein